MIPKEEPCFVKSRKPKKQSARLRSREATCLKLLKAGKEIFSRYGFDGATTKLIAKKSGINEALIIRYFQSKAGLLNAIVVDFVKRARESASQYPRGKTLEEEIRNFLLHRLEFVDGTRDFQRIALMRMLAEKKLKDKISITISNSSLSPLLPRLQEFKKAGQIAHGRDPLAAAQAVNLTIMGLILNNAICGKADYDILMKTVSSLASSLSLWLRTPVR